MNAGAYSALDASVLVLNKTFVAVHIVSVRRAFCLLCKDLAEVVSLDDGQYNTYDFASWSELSAYRASHFRKEEDDWVRTPTSEIQAPRVVRRPGSAGSRGPGSAPRSGTSSRRTGTGCGPGRRCSAG